MSPEEKAAAHVAWNALAKGDAEALTQAPPRIYNAVIEAVFMGLKRGARFSGRNPFD